MDFKKINFKQPRYAFPLIGLPFVLFISYQANAFFAKGKDDSKIEENKEFSLSLGETTDSILNKNDAYESTFSKGDNRTLLGGLDKEQDSLLKYSDNLNINQKRYIDSIRATQNAQLNNGSNAPRSYYRESAASRNTNDDRDYQRSADLIKMLNSQGAEGRKGNSGQQVQSYAGADSRKEEDPVTTLKKQMLVMDSLEKSRDPEYQKSLKAEQNLKKNKEKIEAFLKTTLRVSKSALNPSFNTVSKNKEDVFIKAVIDESIKGYLGSRIRLRLLEDISVGKNKISKGNFLYAQISGFDQQRVNLSIISVLNNGEILPINLSVFDVDGMKGLYVPASMFREMMREMGTSSVQGTQLQGGQEGFFTSMASKLFSSTSTSIANLIRKNKAKLKYNSYIYLINEKDLKNDENN